MTSVPMIPVSSSNVMSVGYDDGNQALHVQFKGNRCYVYSGVPKVKFDELVCATSIGSYLNQNIKNVYPAARVA